MEMELRLKEVGNEGRFQVYVNIFSALVWIMSSINTFLPSYFLITPTFTCSSVQSVKEIDACPVISTCTIEQLHTVTHSAALYCDQLYIRNSILSAQFAGCIVGLLIIPSLSDRFGRKIIIIVTLIINLLASSLLTVGAILSILPLIFIGNIIIGLTYVLPLLMMTYVPQICSAPWKTQVPIIGYAFWAIGEILLYPIITFITNLVYLFCFIYILPLVFLLILSIFLVESPEYLYLNKRYQECKASLDYIARFNGKQQLTLFEEPQPKNDELSTAAPSDVTFFSWKLMVPLMILSLAHFCSSGFYYTIQYSMDQYGFRFEFNMLLVGCMEFLSCLITNFVAPRLKRKPTIIFLLMVPGILGISNQFISSKIVDFIFLGFMRFFLTSSFTEIFLIAAQTFPLELRARAFAVPEICAMVSNMIAPFLVILANNKGIKPQLIGGIMSIIAGFVMFLARETKVQINEEQVDNKNGHEAQQMSQGIMT